MVVSPARTSLDRMAGRWTMHTYIGERVFDDRLELSPDAQGELKGSVSVPGGFTAAVENLQGPDETHFSFEIRPDEGQGPFRVAYRGGESPPVTPPAPSSIRRRTSSSASPACPRTTAG